MMTCESGSSVPISWRNIWYGRGCGSLDDVVASGKLDARACTEGIPAPGEREIRAGQTPWRLTGGQSCSQHALHAPASLQASANEALDALGVLPAHSRGVSQEEVCSPRDSAPAPRRQRSGHDCVATHPQVEAVCDALRTLVATAGEAAADPSGSLVDEPMLLMPGSVREAETTLQEEAAGAAPARKLLLRLRCMRDILRVQTRLRTMLRSRQLPDLTPPDASLAAISVMGSVYAVQTTGQNIRAAGTKARPLESATLHLRTQLAPPSLPRAQAKDHAIGSRGTPSFFASSLGTTPLAEELGHDGPALLHFLARQVKQKLRDESAAGMWADEGE